MYILFSSINVILFACTDGQEQRTHSKEEENRPQSQSQTQREIQTRQDSQEGSGTGHKRHKMPPGCVTRLLSYSGNEMTCASVSGS